MGMLRLLQHRADNGTRSVIADDGRSARFVKGVASTRELAHCALDAGVDIIEMTARCGFGAEVVALVQQHCFWNLEAPVLRVTGWDSPFPHAQEREYMPSRERIVGAIRSTLAA